MTKSAEEIVEKAATFTGVVHARDFIEVILMSHDGEHSNEPIPFAKCKVTFQNGYTINCESDGNGVLRFSKEAEGEVEIELLKEESSLPSSETEEVETEEGSEPAAETVHNSSQPTILPRSEWNARNPSGNYTNHRPQMVTIHHTGFDRDLAAPQWIRRIQDDHMDPNGRIRGIDIGYHFLIDRVGNIYEGRPVTVRGAHVGNHNNNNVGIAVLGNYNERDINEHQQRAIERLVAWIANGGSGAWQPFPINGNAVRGHRDFSNTDCPGDYLYNDLHDIRNGATALAAPR